MSVSEATTLLYLSVSLSRCKSIDRWKRRIYLWLFLSYQSNGLLCFQHSQVLSSLSLLFSHISHLFFSLGLSFMQGRTYVGLTRKGRKIHLNFLRNLKQHVDFTTLVLNSKYSTRKSWAKSFGSYFFRSHFKPLLRQLHVIFFYIKTQFKSFFLSGNCYCLNFESKFD